MFYKPVYAKIKASSKLVYFAIDDQLRRTEISTGEGYIGEGYIGEGYIGEGYTGEGYIGEGYIGEGYIGEGYIGEGGSTICDRRSRQNLLQVIIETNFVTSIPSSLAKITTDFLFDFFKLSRIDISVNNQCKQQCGINRLPCGSLCAHVRELA